jgi:cbb3-type cytochrome oxidase subunit 1
MTKGINATLYSKTLSSITFWGYLFLLPWTNYKFHYGSVLPDWIENVSLYLSLGLAIPLLSLLANYLKTVSTRETENLIIYELVNVSFVVFFITNIFQIVSAFSNLIPILSVTSFESAIRYGYIYSLVLIVVPFVYYLIPRIFGREVVYTRMESANSFLLKSVILLTLFINGLIGINSGYSWNAGANSGNPTIYGEGYLITWSLIGTPYTLNLFLSLLMLIGVFLFSITTVRAISSGPITKVESVELIEEESNE